VFFKALHWIHKGGGVRFIPVNAKNIHHAIHALFVTFPQPPPLYFHTMEKTTGAME
jgi:phage gp46-like protein